MFTAHGFLQTGIVGGDNIMDKATAKFASTLLNASTTIHFMHLRTDSYAAHMALAELYSALPGLVDSVVECFQGKYDKIAAYPNQTVTDGTGEVQFVQALIAFVEEQRQNMPQDSELQNLIDEVADQLNSTAYKLRFLK